MSEERAKQNFEFAPQTNGSRNSSQYIFKNFIGSLKTLQKRTQSNKKSVPSIAGLNISTQLQTQLDKLQTSRGRGLNLSEFEPLDNRHSNNIDLLKTDRLNLLLQNAPNINLYQERNRNSSFLINKSFINRRFISNNTMNHNYSYHSLTKPNNSNKKFPVIKVPGYKYPTNQVSQLTVGPSTTDEIRLTNDLAYFKDDSVKHFENSPNFESKVNFSNEQLRKRENNNSQDFKLPDLNIKSNTTVMGRQKQSNGVVQQCAFIKYPKQIMGPIIEKTETRKKQVKYNEDLKKQMKDLEEKIRKAKIRNRKQIETNQELVKEHKELQIEGQFVNKNQKEETPQPKEQPDQMEPSHENIIKSYTSQLDRQKNKLSKVKQQTNAVYQHLVLQDLKTELDKVRLRCNEASVNNTSSERIIVDLRFENAQLLQNVARYQQMVKSQLISRKIKVPQELNEKTKTNQTYNQSLGETTGTLPSIDSLDEEERKKIIGEGDTYNVNYYQVSYQQKKKTGVSQKGSINTIDINQLETMTYQLHYITRENKNFFEQNAKKTLQCQNVSVYVCNPLLEQQYIDIQNNERQQLIKKVQVEDQTFSCIFLSLEEQPDEFLPQSLDDFKEGILTTTGILMGAFSSENQLMFGIQALQPNMKKSGDVNQRRKFNKKDILKLKVLAKFLGQKGENLMMRVDSQIKSKQVNEIITTVREILNQRNHDKMLGLMQKKIPELFKFEGCNIILHDIEKKDLFQIVGVNDPNKIPYENFKIRFPMSVGLTGIAAKNMKIIFCNEIKKEYQFNSDIDNMIGYSSIKEYLAVPFSYERSAHAPLIGIAQLLNYQGKAVFTRYNLDQVEAFRPFIGAALDKITLLNNAIEISFQVGQELANIDDLLLQNLNQFVEKKIEYFNMEKNLALLKRLFDAFYSKVYKRLEFYEN